MPVPGAMGWCQVHAEIEISRRRQQRLNCDAKAPAIQFHARIRESSLGVRLAAASGMAGFRDFREIVAWQLAHQLKIRVDAFLCRPDFQRRFKFCDQLSDSARSAPRNIAEGLRDTSTRSLRNSFASRRVRKPKC